MPSTTHHFGHTNHTGNPPRRGHYISSVLVDLRPDLAALDPVLARALAKDPDDRFPRCSDFARALAEQAYKHGSPSPATATKPAPICDTTQSSPGHRLAEIYRRYARIGNHLVEVAERVGSAAVK